MTLELLKVYNIDPNSSKYFENVSEELILFTLEMQDDTIILDSRPYHWRCDFGDFPPLDISLDSETGLFKEFTVFISKKDIKRSDECTLLHLPIFSGYPAFNTDIWGKHEYYYDEFVAVNINVSGRNLCIIKQNNNPVRRLKVNATLDILIDEDSLFAGFIIKNLTDKEVGLFK